MTEPIYWNLRRQSGHRTRITDAELEELNWRALAILLEHFERHIDNATDESYLSRLVSDLEPTGETYGKFVTEACLHSASDVYEISELEALNKDTESARKSNMYFRMFLDVWQEVVGVRDAPMATSRSVEAIKGSLAGHLHTLLFGTRAKTEHHFDQRDIDPESLRSISDAFLNIRRAYARHSAHERPGDDDVTHASRSLEGQLRAFGARLPSALSASFLSKITASTREAIIVQGNSFPFPLELCVYDGQFLSTRHIMVRHFLKSTIPAHPIPTRPIQKLLYVSDPSGSLPYESVESVFFSDVICPSHEIEVTSPYRMSVQEFRKYLTDSSFDAIHFTGHGRYDSSTGESKLLFADGEFSPTDLRRIHMKSAPRLVVLNACCTVADTTLGQPASGAAASFAKEFLVKGTEAVIGTLWPIGDCSAARFSATFYRFLLDCQLHAETALLMTKRRYLPAADTVDIAGYVLYSKPGAHVQTMRKEWMVS